MAGNTVVKTKVVWPYKIAFHKLLLQIISDNYGTPKKKIGKMTLLSLLFIAKGSNTKHSCKSYLWERCNALHGLKEEAEKMEEFSTKITPETNRAVQGQKLGKIRKGRLHMVDINLKRVGLSLMIPVFTPTSCYCSSVTQIYWVSNFSNSFGLNSEF